ncbi:MAG: methyltransferase domain-containing protein [Rhodopirellula sp.]|nr:methyltransferase domain-containing protein [Rhodopirellula sp.]
MKNDLRSIGLILALSAFLGPAVSRGQELSVRPEINKPYRDPNVERQAKSLERETREVAGKRDGILAACRLEPEMDVADIGAGTGLFARPFARKVAPGGKVYAVDIAQKFIDHILATCREQGIDNVTGIVGSDTSTKLPPDSIDLAFICDTYHHFEFPQKMLASIHQALRSGGRLIIVDYRKEEGVSPEWIMKHVRADEKMVVEEVTDAGFKLLGKPDLLQENYLLEFEKVK